MSVRRLLMGVATTSLVASGVCLAAPAQADPTFAPLESDVVGAGSDTSMYALTYLADGHGGVTGYNAARTTGRLVSFDAKVVDAAGAQTNSKTVVLRQGATAVDRPNGSGAGKKLLYGSGNNADVDFARSSSGLDAAEKAAGLQAFPFAKDTLAMAVSASSNAPVVLSEADIVKIYTGAVKDWSAVGGKAGAITPLIPQAGSGTRSFFESELKRMNGGTSVVLGTGVKEVQEHDDSPIKGDAGAIAPFSAGRAELLGTLRLTDGFEAGRALYNVVRQADVAKKEITDVFGRSGFVCSPEAAALIADAGFEQLLSADKGGACGVATQDAPDLATALVETTSTVDGTSAGPGLLTLTATVGGGGALKPQGVVEFYLGGATTPAGTALVTGGKATLSLAGRPSGAVQVVAKFVPNEGSVFSASTSSGVTVTVQAVVKPPVVRPPVVKAATATLKETFPATVKKGKRAKGSIVVKLSNGKKATGTVTVKLGKKKVGTAKVRNGKATLTLKKIAKGRKTLVVSFKPAAGSQAKGKTLRFTIRQR